MSTKHRHGILFVDDEHQSLKYFRLAFANRFDIITADNAATALDILRERASHIGVIITDQRMPGTSGLELLHQAHLEFPMIVRMLTTAFVDLDDAIEAVNSGEIFRYITKPWDIDELANDLSAAIERFESRLHNRDLIDARRQTMISLAANMAHEIRTPLVSIRSAADGINQYLQPLLDTYALAKGAGLDVPSLRIPHLEALANAPNSIMRDVDQANTVIDMLLINSREDQHMSVDLTSLSMANCIQEALHRFPFNGQQEQSVHLNIANDFQFMGSDVMFYHVLYNLLRNALYAIQASGSGEIEISLSCHMEHEDWNTLLFKDTGTGIPPQVAAHIFEPFFSTKESGVGNGIGLAFCRRIITAFGGKIEVQSQQDQYTQFIISLPSITTLQGVRAD